MGLYVFHCVLIASAALFFGFFGVFALLHQGRNADEDSVYFLLGIASLLIAALVSAYLIYFIRKLVRLYRAGEIR
jgi:hypothetical protein